MSGQDESGPSASLTGMWHGQFSYPRIHGPEFFTANLIETADFLGGSIQEVSQVGRSRGKVLYATIRGHRLGSSVNFLKQYESPTRTHGVHYDGLVSADGMEIEGTWMVSGSWSGRFLMIRNVCIGQSSAQTISVSV